MVKSVKWAFSGDFKCVKITVQGNWENYFVNELYSMCLYLTFNLVCRLYEDPI